MKEKELDTLGYNSMTKELKSEQTSETPWNNKVDKILVISKTQIHSKVKYTCCSFKGMILVKMSSISLMCIFLCVRIMVMYLEQRN